MRTDFLSPEHNLSSGELAKFPLCVSDEMFNYENDILDLRKWQKIDMIYKNGAISPYSDAYSRN